MPDIGTFLSHLRVRISNLSFARSPTASQTQCVLGYQVPYSESFPKWMRQHTELRREELADLIGVFRAHAVVLYAQSVTYLVEQAW